MISPRILKQDDLERLESYLSRNVFERLANTPTTASLMHRWYALKPQGTEEDSSTQLSMISDLIVEYEATISDHHHAAIYERLYNTPTISSRLHRSPPRQPLVEELLTAASSSDEDRREPAEITERLHTTPTATSKMQRKSCARITEKAGRERPARRVNPGVVKGVHCSAAATPRVKTIDSSLPLQVEPCTPSPGNRSDDNEASPIPDYSPLLPVRLSKFFTATRAYRRRASHRKNECASDKSLITPSLNQVKLKQRRWNRQAPMRIISPDNSTTLNSSSETIASLLIPRKLNFHPVTKSIAPALPSLLTPSSGASMDSTASNLEDSADMSTNNCSSTPLLPILRDTSANAQEQHLVTPDRSLNPAPRNPRETRRPSKASHSRRVSFPAEEEVKQFFQDFDLKRVGMLSLNDIDNVIDEFYPALDHKALAILAYRALETSQFDLKDASEFQQFLHFLAYFNNLWKDSVSVDEANSLVISRAEFTEMVGKLSLFEDANAAFNEMDMNNSGFIHFDKFCSLCAWEKLKLGRGNNGSIEQTDLNGESQQRNLIVEEEKDEHLVDQVDIRDKDSVPQTYQVPTTDSHADAKEDNPSSTDVAPVIDLELWREILDMFDADDFPTYEMTLDLFRRIDVPNTGFVSFLDIQNGIHALYKRSRPFALEAYKKLVAIDMLNPSQFHFLLLFLVYFNNLWAQFASFGRSMDWWLSKEQFLQVARSLDLFENMEETFATLDPNGRGFILFAEFCVVCASRKHELSLCDAVDGSTMGSTLLG